MSDKEKKANPELELMILDSLEVEVFKSIKQISTETGFEEEEIRIVLESMSKDLAIISRGSLFRWANDIDIFEDDFEDDHIK